MNVQVALVEHFQDIASQFNDIVCLVDSQGRIVDVNDRLLERYGHRRAALVGEPVAMLCPPEGRDAAIARVKEALRTGGLRVQVTHVTQAGIRFPVEISVRRIERNGRPYLHGVVRDLTAQRDAEAALAASEARLRLATEAGRVGIWEWNLVLDKVNWNPVLAELFEIPATGFNGRYESFRESVHPEDLDLFDARVREARDRRTSFAAQFRLLLRDGRVRWLSARGNFEYGPDGRATHMRGTVVDISARKAADARIAQLGRLRGAMSDVNRALMHERKESGLFSAVCQALVSAQAATYCGIARVDAASETLPTIAAAGPDLEPFMAAHVSLRADLPHGQGPMGRAAREGITQVVNDYAEDPSVEPWRELAASLGLRTGAAFPLRRGGRIWGTLAVYDGVPYAFDRELRSILEVVAGDVSFALDVMDQNREREESEQRFRAMVEQSITGIYILSAEGDLVYANPRCAEIFGYESPEAMIAHRPESMMMEADRARVTQDVGMLMSGKVPAATFNFTGVRKDGSHVEIGAHRTAIQYRGKRAIIGVMQDISDKLRAEERIKEYIGKLEHALLSTVAVVSAIGELRDPYTHGHERRVGGLAAAIATEMGLDADRVEGIRIGGHLHDVGKIAVPAEILAKPGRLSPVEMELIRQHAQQGYEILKGVEFAWPIAEMARSHHERLDGSGYPRGLKGEAIILEARILTVADVVEAMSTHRPYRPGLGIVRALAEVERGRGTQYDPGAVDACVRLFREKGYELDS